MSLILEKIPYIPREKTTPMLHMVLCKSPKCQP